MNIDYKEILRHTRKKLGLTQGGLAKAMGYGSANRTSKNIIAQKESDRDRYTRPVHRRDMLVLEALTARKAAGIPLDDPNFFPWTEQSRWTGGHKHINTPMPTLRTSFTIPETAADSEQP